MINLELYLRVLVFVLCVTIIVNVMSAHGELATKQLTFKKCATIMSKSEIFYHCVGSQTNPHARVYVTIFP